MDKALPIFDRSTVMFRLRGNRLPEGEETELEMQNNNQQNNQNNQNNQNKQNKQNNQQNNSQNKQNSQNKF